MRGGEKRGARPRGGPKKEGQGRFNLTLERDRRIIYWTRRTKGWGRKRLMNQKEGGVNERTFHSGSRGLDFTA